MATLEDKDLANTPLEKDKSPTKDSLMFKLTAHHNSKPPLTQAQFQLPLKPTKLLSNHTLQVSSPTLHAEPHWITVLSLLDMELKTDKNSGESETHGELDGEKQDMSDLPRMEMALECAVFKKLPHTPKSDLVESYSNYLRYFIVYYHMDNGAFPVIQEQGNTRTEQGSLAAITGKASAGTGKLDSTIRRQRFQARDRSWNR